MKWTAWFGCLLLIFLCFANLSPLSAHPEPSCYSREDAAKLFKKWGMERTWRGFPGPIGIIELWVNKYGRFSIGLTTFDGKFYCPMAEGEKSLNYGLYEIW